MMERRLIDHARPLARRLPKLELSEVELLDIRYGQEKLAYIESLLGGLAAINPNFRNVVEYRVFMGMSLEEIAAEMGYSSRTVATYWSFARNWLEQKMGDQA